MTDVYFKQASYDYAVLKPAVFDMIDSIGTLSVEEHSRVLIKPNLLLPAAPEKALLTHPLIVRAVVEYVLEKGASPVIADSPAMGSIRKIYTEGGYEKALEGLDVEFKAFETSVKVDVGEPFGRIDIARDVMEADMVINLPKLKTHAMMLLTLGVKNLFGCIVGLKKPEWHFRVGVNKAMFARLLVRISTAVNPTLTLIDGILGMEGQGPGKGGTPRPVGVLIGGSDVSAVDWAVCRMLDVAPQALWTVNEALQAGLLSEDVTIHGDFNTVEGYRLPEQGPTTFGPPYAQQLMRRHVLQRPEVDLQTCRLCGKCAQYCPAKAITISRKRIYFDYEKCIRCYCCVEVCPYGALQAKEPLAGKVVRQLKRVISRL